MQKSNKWNAAADVLKVSKRLENLSKCERRARAYLKKNTSYWDDEIKAKRARQRLTVVSSCTNNASETNSVDIDRMTALEIKQHLNGLGITTRLRNINKLRELLENVLLEISE